MEGDERQAQKNGHDIVGTGPPQVTIIFIREGRFVEACRFYGCLHFPKQGNSPFRDESYFSRESQKWIGISKVRTHLDGPFQTKEALRLKGEEERYTFHFPDLFVSG